MVRQFAFEAGLNDTLECLPMAVKRKLDRLVLKIDREQWTAMEHEERRAICQLPAESANQREALYLFIREVLAREGSAPISLPESVRGLAEPPAEVPAAVIASAEDVGFFIDQQKWARLDSDERYALTKLLNAGKKRKLARALAEFFPEQRSSGNDPIT